MLQMSKSNRLLRTRRIQTPSDIRVEDAITYDQDVLVIVASDIAKTWEIYLNMIAKTKIKRALVVLVTPVQEHQLQKMLHIVQRLSENMYFYLTLTKAEGDSHRMWYHVISIKGNERALLQVVHFDKNGKIVETYDMEGMHITCLTLSWSPYLTLSDCDSNGKNCESSGYLAEIMNSVGKRLNFTWHCDKERSNNWGIIQISGPSNSSGVWGGVIGGVVNGTYPICISMWANFESRIGLLDFVIGGRATQNVMAFFPQMANFDRTLFLRPFTNEVWLIIGIVNLTIFACFSLTGWLALKLRTSCNSLRLVRSVTWLSYLLNFVYYGGALKMFFTAEITNPFDSRRDVMNSYPEWKLKIRKGNEKYFLNRAEKGDDPLDKEFWNRLMKYPEEYRFGDIKEGIKEISVNQSVIHVDPNSLVQYYKDFPETKLPETLPSEYFSRYMIVTENSPLYPILDQELKRFGETGIFDAVNMEWIGRDLPKYEGIKNPDALEPGQVSMIFIILCSAVMVSVVVLSFERIYFAFKGSRNTRSIRNSM
jgi:hypothetical protein